MELPLTEMERQREPGFAGREGKKELGFESTFVAFQSLNFNYKSIYQL